MHALKQIPWWATPICDVIQTSHVVAFVTKQLHTSRLLGRGENQKAISEKSQRDRNFAENKQMMSDKETKQMMSDKETKDSSEKMQDKKKKLTQKEQGLCASLIVHIIAKWLPQLATASNQLIFNLLCWFKAECNFISISASRQSQNPFFNPSRERRPRQPKTVSTRTLEMIGVDAAQIHDMEEAQAEMQAVNLN